MNTAAWIHEVKGEFRHFAEVAAPFCHITSPGRYEQALELIESLLEEAKDSKEDPLNVLISMLSDAIEEYESRDRGLLVFEHQVKKSPAGLALLRVLMDQHGLGMAGLPEIGSKSMVSRVLSSERSLSTKHIQALSKRFGIDPGMFF